MNDLLYKYVSIMPPWIILFYFYGKNIDAVSYWQTLIAAFIFSLLSLIFYIIVSNIEKSRRIYTQYSKSGRAYILKYSAPAAALTIALWIISAAIMPLYDAMLEIFTKPVRYAACSLCAAAAAGAVFILSRNIKRKEIFILAAVFETVLFALNFIPGTFLFAARKDVRIQIPVDVIPPPPRSQNYSEMSSPNIYWIFMDGMLGFYGMERLFGDNQKEFTASLVEEGFQINRKAEFEVFHGTTRATAALMSPSWYDNEFLPILHSIDIDDYNAKQKALGNLNPLFARRNNELIRAFIAKDYSVNIISGEENYFITNFYETADNLFYNGKLILNPNVKLFVSYIQFNNLNSILGGSLAPWTIIDEIVAKFAAGLYEKALNAAPVPVIVDKAAIYGYEYGGDSFGSKDDRWFIDAIAEISARQTPQFTIVHDLKAHFDFIRNEDGSLAHRAGNEGRNFENYPPQHRYAAKIVLAYTDFIIERDYDAIIVIEADHGLHMTEAREQLLAQNKTDEDVRVIQNQVMSAVRIPEKWGGLDEPLDPLNISRVLANRYAGKNYQLLESHP